MRVYHFLNEEYGLKNLSKKRLKIATLMELNDPFEFLGVKLSDPTHRSAMKKTKSDLSKTFGMVCFSEDYHSPVQWAHYSDNHKGICIGFDITDDKLSQIKYVDERGSLPENIEEIDQSFMKKLMHQKFSHWSYEKEWRIFVSLDEQEDGIYYVNFSNEIQVKEVIVGCVSQISRKKVSEALGELDGKVKVFKARPAFKDFKIVENQNSSLWE